MHCKSLNGHSGCRVFLIEDGKNIFIRKISSSPDYNARLMLQAKKQADFEGISVSAPKIYRTGFTPEALFYFDMEYISGITLAEYMKTIQVSSIRSVVKSLTLSITGSEHNSGVAADKAFSEKTASLKDKLSASENTAVHEALDMLAAHSWSNFCASPCHGDMTLENIIIKDGRLYLIDFLDSFYDCWILDAAALLQDVQIMWSYRQSEKDTNTAIRLMIFRDIMTDMISEMAGGVFVAEAYYALLLKLLRIYPYTSDELTLSFLNSRTEAVIKMIRQLP